MTEENNDIFINLYNELDQLLSEKLGITYSWPERDYVWYMKKVRDLKYWNNPVKGYIRYHYGSLEEIWHIRNELLHKYNKHLRVSEHTIHTIEEHIRCIKHPNTGYDLFKREVYQCRDSDLLKDVILIMKKNNFTHIPVRDERGVFKWIISESTVTYFIGEKIESDGTLILDTTYIKNIDLTIWNDIYKFISHKATVYEIEEDFQNAIKDNKRLWAIFITKDWDSKNSIDGVITAWDIPQIQY